MIKHVIGYGVLVVAIVVLTAQIMAEKGFEHQAVETEIAPPEIKKLKDKSVELTEKIEKMEGLLKDKDSQISLLKKTIEHKDDKIKLVSKKSDEPKDDAKENQIKNVLESVSGFMNSEENRKMQKKFMKMRFASLFKKLNLSDKDAETLLDLMIDRDRQRTAVFADLFKNGGRDIDHNALKEAQSNTEAEKQIADFLGDDYSKLKRYEETQFERAQLKGITASLDEQDSLNEEQEDKLIDLMAQRNKDRMSGNKQEDESYLTEASQFLNDNQVNEVRKSFKRNQNNGNVQVLGNGVTSDVQVLTIP